MKVLLLATSGHNGATQALLSAHGFDASMIAGLVNRGMAALTAEKIRAGGKPTEDLGPPPSPLPAVPMRTPSNANPVSSGAPWVQSGYAMATKRFSRRIQHPRPTPALESLWSIYLIVLVNASRRHRRR